ncbi:MAG: energy transducer TonB [Candidatus Fermentibacteraceae bacterium]|nr:energy transducer TonB [Candidatus Fermentibacteraceae bacterium]MBN2609592.1 energy transducer TonB [Candidatus Fermentibacteraceae bacterium]
MAEKRTEFRHSSLNFELGVAIGLAFLIVLFEFIPASQLGRLSTRTTDSEMEAVEADLAFDDSVEEQEEEVQEEQEELQQETEQMVEEINQDITLSLDADTTGLETVETVEQGEELGDSQTEEMGPPRFMPAEVFPNCTYKPPPQYPEMAAQAGVEGTTTLWVYVASDGSVSDVRLYNSSGVNSLDQAALSAAWNTRWTPAQNNGIPVGVWTTLTYNFVLTD